MDMIVDMKPLIINGMRVMFSKLSINNVLINMSGFTLGRFPKVKVLSSQFISLIVAMDGRCVCVNINFLVRYCSFFCGPASLKGYMFF